MRADGNAGDELTPGEIGTGVLSRAADLSWLCQRSRSYRRAISRDGFLYTGDLGYKDAAGLHLTGREKWVIKSLGYQIFPGDVEGISAALAEKVANCVVVGVAHEVVSEAVVAVVEKRPGVEAEPPGTGSARAYLALLYAAAPLDHSRSRPDAAEPRGQAGLRARPGDGSPGDRRSCAPAASGIVGMLKTE
jgi:acyl-CoA synthetase (AMP-forming)/AMP-acid ligase II